MIQEVIVTTRNSEGLTHIAPMGIHFEADAILILPFRPSSTLNNILESQSAVINYCDDVRIFAGCLTGRRDWPLQNAEKISGYRLQNTLAHVEVELTRIEDDPVRPKLFCHPIYSANHAPFQGFNRAQHAVLEAAILVSRLDRLPLEKLKSELDYLKIGIDKTAGPRELEAWEWLMPLFERHFANQAT